jgi:acetyltransferase-like isoleucine patch superfamily enzyme
MKLNENKLINLSSIEKINYYKKAGAKIGKEVEIGLGSLILGEKIEIGDYVKIGKNSRLEFTELKIKEKVTIGDNVDIRSENIQIDEKVIIGKNNFALVPSKFKIGKNSIINDNNSIKCREFIVGEFLYMEEDIKIGEGGEKGPNSNILIGNYCMLCRGVVLNPSEKITIGDYVGIGQDVMIWTHGGFLPVLEGFPAKFGPVKIGHHVWIPARTILLPGVKIGSNVVIGINSLVNKDIPSNCLAAGIPIKILKENCYPKKLSLDEKDKILNDFLNEYILLIRYKGFNVKEDKNEKARKIIVNNSRIIIYSKSLKWAIESSLTFKKRKKLLIIFLINDYNLKFDTISNTYFNIDKMDVIGELDNLGEDIRDFLRRKGLKFYTSNHFKSIIPPIFEKFIKKEGEK